MLSIFDCDGDVDTTIVSDSGCYECDAPGCECYSAPCDCDGTPCNVG